MNRKVLTDGSGRWFDADKAESFEEHAYYDGCNFVSSATGSEWDHQALYKTAGGIWILNAWSNWQGTKETYSEISKQEAASWLSRNHYDPHKDCETEYNNLEIF